MLYPLFVEHGLKLCNRIIWHFEHGLHCSKRFSGRYETILWFTKGDSYVFNLDPVRVPQKYPQKRYFRGPRIGELSCNPLGKNPGDLVIDPYMGVGSTAVAAVLHGRRVAGADIVAEYIDIARDRVRLASDGQLLTRPMDRPVYQPPTAVTA